MGNLPLLQDALDALPHTRRSMFGGHGAFAPNGGMFAAIVPGDRIALKLARLEDFAEFLAEGAEPWVYDERVTMSSWAVIPESYYDEPRRLAEWARRAHATAVPSKSKTAGKKAAGKKAPASKATPTKAPAAKGGTKKRAAAPAARKAAPQKTAAKKAPTKAAKKGGSPRRA